LRARGAEPHRSPLLKQWRMGGERSDGLGRGDHSPAARPVKTAPEEHEHSDAEGGMRDECLRRGLPSMRQGSKPDGADGCGCVYESPAPKADARSRKQEFYFMMAGDSAMTVGMGNSDGEEDYEDPSVDEG
jgi:hypothetical protein